MYISFKYSFKGKRGKDSFSNYKYVFLGIHSSFKKSLLNAYCVLWAILGCQGFNNRQNRPSPCFRGVFLLVGFTVIYLCIFWSFKIFIYLFKYSLDNMLIILERGEWWEKEGERNINVREKHQLVASCTHPDQEPDPQPRHVPWTGIKPMTFQFMGTCSNQLIHIGQDNSVILYLS